MFVWWLGERLVIYYRLSFTNKEYIIILHLFQLDNKLTLLLYRTTQSVGSNVYYNFYLFLKSKSSIFLFASLSYRYFVGNVPRHYLVPLLPPSTGFGSFCVKVRFGTIKPPPPFDHFRPLGL